MKPLEPKSLFARRYEVVRCISTGGMGAVYEVVHLDTKRRRALKVMLPSLLIDDEMRRRFALEAVITANVSSEHLIEVFDAGIEPDSGCPFLAMELLDGQDLGKQLASGGPLAPSETVELMRQAARALDRTHAAGIVHRDLKPENLFIARRDDGSPKIKILDFGIAKLLASQGGPTSRAIGTPLFMAPEQIDDTMSPVGPAADLYAVGQITFALLAGSPYFAEEAKRTDNVLGILLNVAKGTIEPASKRAARRGVTLPAGFDEWFARATAREPEDRFKNAREMIDALAVAVGVDPRPERAPAREPVAVEAKSASATKPRWTSTEVIADQPTPAKAAAEPSAASSTASLDPTVTSNTATGRKSRAPLLLLLAVPALLAVGYVALDRSPAPSAEPSARELGEQTGTESTATATATATASGPLVVPTPAPSAEPTVELAATASGEPKSKASAKATTEKRPGVLPKASVATPVVTVAPAALPWEVRTPVKQP